MDPGALRNFKDFLQMYNKMTEICFTRCIDNINGRKLDQNEIDCVEDCSTKFIKFNNKLMQNFVKAQTEIVNKRVSDADQLESNRGNPKQTELEDNNNSSAAVIEQDKLANSTLEDKSLVQSDNQIIVSN